MSLKSKRICKCCGKEYTYCPNCGSRSDEMWRNLTDTKECLAVFNIVAAYNVGRATAEQVEKVIKDNNIKDYAGFNPAIVATLDEILKPVNSPIVEPEIKKIIPVTKVVTENVIAPVQQVELEDEQPNAPVVRENVARKNRNGKKKYRRNTDIGL